MLEVDLFGDEVIEEMPQAEILRLVGLHHVERERLKEKAAVDDEARLHVVGMPLEKIGPERLQFDASRSWAACCASRSSFTLSPLNLRSTTSGISTRAPSSSTKESLAIG